jgi:hypothetical protein
MVDNTNMESRYYFGKFYFDENLTDSDKNFIMSLYNDYVRDGLDEDLAFKKALAIFKMFYCKKPRK